MKKLLFATHNPSKLFDFKDILGDLGFDVLSLEDLKITQTADETGTTFAENSLLKAKFYANISGTLTLADDGGLTIDSLGGAPGVYTRRWESEKELNDQQLIDKILLKLKDFKGEERKAYLRSIITVYNPEDGEYIQTSGEIEGRIIDGLTTKITPGYPIRSIFYVPSAGKIFSLFTKREKEKYNHRRLAIQKILPDLIKLK